MLTLNDGRSELWQWDTGRKLTVDAECSQVHFSNKVFGRSVDVDVVDGVAIIPDILLQIDKDLTAWAFVGTAENGYTKISKVFKVNRRNKPADYVFTPPEQTSLEEIKEKIDYLESIQDPDAIKNAVDDYLANNPIKVNETDPTVPEWAKKPNPPDVKIPDKLPNPHSITFTGAVDASYDGSNPVEIKIPDSGGNVAYDEAQNLTDAQKAQARENIGAQPKGNYLTEVPEGYAKTDDIPSLDGYAKNEDVPTDAEIIQLIKDNAPKPSGGGISVTGAKVGQTVKIAEVDENGVPTAWVPTDFPSGGSGGGTPFKLLASAEPITEPVPKIEVSITEDGITEIYLVGKAKQAEANSYPLAYVGVNGKSASYNTKITEAYESFVLYHGVLLDGGHFLGELSIAQYADVSSLGAMKIPQNGFDGFKEQVKTVTLSHSGFGLLAIGTYFDVWGR
jgi:hypothetical protein